MTVQDMIVLADMWINLSQPMIDQIPDEIILLGDLTGRLEDRRFSCKKMPSCPTRCEDEAWEDYLHRAVDHIDFIEVKGGASCFSASTERPVQEKAT